MQEPPLRKPASYILTDASGSTLVVAPVSTHALESTTVKPMSSPTYPMHQYLLAHSRLRSHPPLPYQPRLASLSRPALYKPSPS